MNKYLEKIAMEKVSFTVDFEDGTHIGFAANRVEGGRYDVHQALLDAAKKPGVRVTTDYYDERGKYGQADSHKDYNHFVKTMNTHVRRHIDDYVKHSGVPYDPKIHMDWNRDLSYSVSVPKSSVKDFGEAYDRAVQAVS